MWINTHIIGKSSSLLQSMSKRAITLILFQYTLQQRLQGNISTPSRNNLQATNNTNVTTNNNNVVAAKRVKKRKQTHDWSGYYTYTHTNKHTNTHTVISVGGFFLISLNTNWYVSSCTFAVVDDDTVHVVCMCGSRVRLSVCWFLLFHIFTIMLWRHCYFSQLCRDFDGRARTPW